jgi:XTP/dITP diphosphohydrolase
MTSGRRLVLATRNAHKVLELQRILSDAGLTDVELVGVEAYPDVREVAETGDTFEANALLKARAVATATGEVAVADDSGLCVDALSGMPGVLSARWSGDLCPDDDRDTVNLRLVLGQVADVPDDRRGASFECAAVAVFPDGNELVAHGRSATEKDAISHRGRAFRALARLLVSAEMTAAEMTAAEMTAAEMTAADAPAERSGS